MKRAIGVTALVVLVESLGPLAAVPFSEQTASSDLARVFIYRYREMFGFANRPSVYCNDIELARIQNGRFFMATLEPGHYSCRSNEREVVAEFDAEAGDVYFLRVQIVERFLGARGRLLHMNPFQAVADLQRLEPLDADQIRDVTRVSTPVAPSAVPEQPTAELSTVALTFHVPPPPEHTPGVEFTLEEVSRHKNSGLTVVDYEPRLSGLPQGKTYELWMRLSFEDPVPLSLPMNLSPDSSGNLVVPASFNANRYHKGEPYELQLRSNDETVHAVAKVFPFPILAEQDGCRVWVEFVKDNFKEVAIWGDGFEPGASVTLSTQDGRDQREQQVTVPPSGVFSRDVNHRNRGGEAGLSAVSNSCSVTLSYDYGKDGAEYQ